MNEKTRFNIESILRAIRSGNYTIQDAEDDLSRLLGEPSKQPETNHAINSLSCDVQAEAGSRGLQSKENTRPVPSGGGTSGRDGSRCREGLMVQKGPEPNLQKGE